MDSLNNVLDTVGDFYEHLKTPMFASAKKIVAPIVAVSTPVFSQAQVATATKAALVFASVTCMVGGATLVVRSVLKNCNIRDQFRAFKAQSLRPKSTGENEQVSSNSSILSKIKSVFSKKLIPFVAGVASFSGGMFLLAHANYFAAALKGK